MGDTLFHTSAWMATPGLLYIQLTGIGHKKQNKVTQGYASTPCPVNMVNICGKHRQSSGHLHLKNQLKTWKSWRSHLIHINLKYHEHHKKRECSKQPNTHSQDHNPWNPLARPWHLLGNVNYCQCLSMLQKDWKYSKINIPPSIPPKAYIALLMLRSQAVPLFQPLSPSPDCVKKEVGIRLVCITRAMINSIRKLDKERYRESRDRADIFVEKKTGITLHTQNPLANISIWLMRSRGSIYLLVTAETAT